MALSNILTSILTFNVLSFGESVVGARNIIDSLFAIAVVDHVDKNIAWEHFSLNLLGNTITHLHNVFQRNPYFQNLILKMSVFNCLLNVGLYLVLITGIGMDNVPFCF